jgi:hypothetical protein
MPRLAEIDRLPISSATKKIAGAARAAHAASASLPMKDPDKINEEAENSSRSNHNPRS